MEDVAMRIQVNGQLCDVEIPDDSGFLDIIKTVTNSIEKPGQGITQVRLNGEDITGEDWDDYAMMKFDEIREIDIETSSLSALARDMCVSLADFMDNLLRELKKTSDQFRLGNEQSGSEIYALSIDGIQIVTHTTVMIQRNLNIPDDISLLDGTTFREHLSQLQTLISDMFSAQENQDWILLADLIEYELIPYFETRRSIVAGWHATIN